MSIYIFTFEKEKTTTVKYLWKNINLRKLIEKTINFYLGMDGNYLTYWEYNLLTVSWEESNKII